MAGIKHEEIRSRGTRRYQIEGREEGEYAQRQSDCPAGSGEPDFIQGSGATGPAAGLSGAERRRKAFLEYRRAPSEQDRAAGAGGGGQVTRAAHDELVREHGEGDGFLGVRIDAVIGAGDKIE